jgi:hypothetical protein
MATTSDETLLVAPVPPRVPPSAPRRDDEAHATALGEAFAPSPDATAGIASEVLAGLQKLRQALQSADEGTFLLGVPPAGAVPDQVVRWHRDHHHLGYLNLNLSLSLEGAEARQINPAAAGATRWAAPAALRFTPLPPIAALLSSLSGPRDVLLAGIEAVLSVQADELAALGAHALLAGLSSAGGVVVRDAPAAGMTAPTTPGRAELPDPAERLAVYRPPDWPRQQRQPGYTVVVEADGAPLPTITSTVDSVLSGSRGDIEIAVRGAGQQQAQLARRYAEEPRFRRLESLAIAPRVLLVAEGSYLAHDSLAALARQHEEHAAGLLLVTHAGDDRRSCAASYETGAWRRATALTGLDAVDGLPPLADLRTVLEPHYETWWCNADDVGLRRPAAVTAASDLLDGTSAPSPRVLAELEKQQQLLASTRAELRTVERELDRLRRHPIVRVGRAVRRRLP